MSLGFNLKYSGFKKNIIGKRDEQNDKILTIIEAG